MNYDPKLTADGLMTLLAGLVAFIAVMRQINASSRETTRQLEARDAERRETQEREREALAIALLLEVDHFYRNFLTKSLLIAEGAKGKMVKADVALGLGESVPPDVYRGNTSKIGTLGPNTAASVIRFYSVAWDLTDTWQRYITCLKQGDPGGFSQNILSAIEAISTNLRLGALETSTWLWSTANRPALVLDIAPLRDKADIEKIARLKGLPLNLPGAHR